MAGERSSSLRKNLPKKYWTRKKSNYRRYWLFSDPNIGGFKENFMRIAGCPSGSVLTDLGLQYKPFCLFGSVKGLYLCQQVCKIGIFHELRMKI